MNDIIKILREFNEARNWEPFHTPENLAKSIAIEAGELLECFQWDSDYDLEALSDEIADVMLYCLMLSDKIGIDIKKEMLRKIEKNGVKYPVETCREE
ncbi:nucleotide pyrophosphohydrolase [Anaerovorax odorimutans]|uniref:Nucleotide pyrophosphohydrolase n=1 Tax=Anaerovorax odorimutans TaxID=109327 RepID=A0ABT1RLL7_9FIRM|nr:nucleotide pyrophosphohydrolase [Anaerovorax odorimutans]MCQ4636073.1 nucleotide pyrophosphohydrolase [Anaerovorax odorimutans]